MKKGKEGNPRSSLVKTRFWGFRETSRRKEGDDADFWIEADLYERVIFLFS